MRLQLFAFICCLCLFDQVWASGRSYEEVLEAMKTEEKKKEFTTWINKEKPWAFYVGAFGRSLSSEEQREKMNFFSSLFVGDEPVDLHHPETTLVVAEVNRINKIIK